MNDFFILYLDRNSYYNFQLTPTWYYDTKFGRFEASEVIGKKYGSKINAKNEKGFGYLFKLTPEFFTSTLRQKTQILYFADIS